MLLPDEVLKINFSSYDIAESLVLVIATLRKVFPGDDSLTAALDYSHLAVPCELILEIFIRRAIKDR